MVIFHSFLYVYQRVYHFSSNSISIIHPNWLLAVVVLNKLHSQRSCHVPLVTGKKLRVGINEDVATKVLEQLVGELLSEGHSKNMQQNAPLQKISWNEQIDKDVFDSLTAADDSKSWMLNGFIRYQILNPHVMMTRIFHVGICRMILM